MRNFEMYPIINSDNAGSFLEDVLKFWNEDPGTPLVLDASQTKYISSAGLRSILTLSKKVKLSIENVNSEVYEVMDITGFTSILKISREIKSFDVSSCPVIGQGGSGTIYRTDKDTVIKVYPDTYDYEAIVSEQNHSKEALINGIPTAIPMEIARVGNSYGVFYEMMNADTLSKAFMSDPEKFDENMDKYVAILERIQATKVGENTSFESMKKILSKRVKRLYEYASKEEADKFAEMVKSMSDEKYLIHGDLHPGNIMVHNGELMLIDMADVTVGPKNYDIIAIYRDLCGSFSFGDENADAIMCNTLGLSKEMVGKIWNAFVRIFYHTNDDNEIAEITKKLHYNYALSATLAMMGFAKETLDKCFPMFYPYFQNILFGENEEAAKAAIKEMLA